MKRLKEPWRSIRALFNPHHPIHRIDRIDRLMIRIFMGIIILCLSSCIAHEVYLRWPR